MINGSLDVADNLQTINTGEAELKNYYEPYNSTYEAIKRRRKKRMAKEGLDLEEDTDFNKVPNPDI